MPSWKFHVKWASRFGIPEDIAQETNRLIDMGNSWFYNEAINAGMIDEKERHDLKRIFRNRSVFETVIREMQIKYGSNFNLYAKAFVLHYLLDKIRDYTRDFLRKIVIKLYLENKEVNVDDLRKYFKDNIAFSALAEEVMKKIVKWAYKNSHVVSLAEDIYNKVMENLLDIIKDLYNSNEVKIDSIYKSAKKELEKIYYEKEKLLKFINEYNEIISLARQYSSASFLRPIDKSELEDVSKLREKLNEAKKILGLIKGRCLRFIPEWLADRARNLLLIIKYPSY